MQIRNDTNVSLKNLEEVMKSSSFPSLKDKSGLVSRNVTIGAHRTSIRLEPDMWTGLREICRREHVTIHDIATVVSVRKALNSSLTAAMRVFVMAYFRMAATEDGHNCAGHGPGGTYMRSLVEKKWRSRIIVRAIFCVVLRIFQPTQYAHDVK